ncbi:hypothetical protein [Deinococcus alpinitundrae]|uniref:hypothetical protein n=1 Tax=Deinococcus alpinitundrae TaxID=468913 RepID=UPI00137B5D85|nr:hypothetical protein [Deinococcus alpinitundrae]
MDEWPISIEQLREELTDRRTQPGIPPLNVTLLNLMLDKGVAVTALVDDGQQRYLRGAIEGQVFETKRCERFTLDTVEELLNLTLPLIRVVDRREHGFPERD